MPVVAEAATFTIDKTTGIWARPVATPTAWGAVTGNRTSRLAWGVAASKSTTRSSYTFADTGKVTKTAPGAFLLGRYTHKNGTIWTASTNLLKADLFLSLTGTANGQAFSLKSSYSFKHTETPNAGPVCPANTPIPCADTIGIKRLTGAPLVIRQGNTIFTLIIDGFVRRLGGPVIKSLLTPENQARSLFLQARLGITVVPPPPPPPVPLPAAAWLMLGGLGALAVVRRRKRA